MTSEGSDPSNILRMNNERLMLFVELYKQHECLWNTALDDYPHKYKRKRAAADIADKMAIDGFTAHHVMVKFKNLRSNYCQELKRIARSEALVASGKAKEVRRPTLCWFPAMDSFIRPHVRQKTAATAGQIIKLKRVKKTSQKEDTKKNVKRMECDVQEHVDLTINKTTQRITIESSETEASNDSHPKGRGSNQKESFYQEFEQFLGQQDLKEEPDEQDAQVQSTTADWTLENAGVFHQCFGKYVASLLSKMPPQKALELQPKILRLIFSKFEEN